MGFEGLNSWLTGEAFWWVLIGSLVGLLVFALWYERWRSNRQAKVQDEAEVWEMSSEHRDAYGVKR